LVLLTCLPLFAADRQLSGTYIATAYAKKGATASGTRVHQQIVAADPKLLPLGTRIQIKNAGPYSGEYIVADTGAKLRGHKLDIYIPNWRACRLFGRKRVQVRVVELGRMRVVAKQSG